MKYHNLIPNARSWCRDSGPRTRASGLGPWPLAVALCPSACQTGSMLLSLLLSLAFAQQTTVIQPIDLSQDGPTHPNYCLLLWNVKALKNPNTHGHSIVRQLSNRVRFEFEGGDIPHGSYTMAVGSSCEAKDYKASWHEVHPIPSAIEAHRHRAQRARDGFAWQTAQNAGRQESRILAGQWRQIPDD